MNTKAYLLKNGAISTNINDSEFQSINGRACTYSEKVLNHAVTIIGWDDNLSLMTAMALGDKVYLLP